MSSDNPSRRTCAEQRSVSERKTNNAHINHNNTASTETPVTWTDYGQAKLKELLSFGGFGNSSEETKPPAADTKTESVAISPQRDKTLTDKSNMRMTFFNDRNGDQHQQAGSRASGWVIVDKQDDIVHKPEKTESTFTTTILDPAHKTSKAKTKPKSEDKESAKQFVVSKGNREIVLEKLRLGVKLCATHDSAEPFTRNVVLEKDYMEKLDISACYPPDGSSFFFREYAPRVFRKLRDYSGISLLDYVTALCDEKISPLGFSGKSGSFLYITKDKKFVIKTVSHAESKFLRVLLEEYYKHLASVHNQKKDSLLTRFFGMYRMGFSTLGELRVVVMQNLLSTRNEIDRRYDLKGSTLGRQTFFSCLIAEQDIANHVLKDNDFSSEDDRVNLTIQLGRARKAKFLGMLHRDCELLRRFGVIDYSLLLGVHFVKDCAKLKASLPAGAEKTDEGAFVSVDYDHLYYCGVIDILQPYNRKKAIEHNVKALWYDRGDISVCNPEIYLKRFLTFISRHIS
eukprot:TRINITY_DN4556_c0_g1_i1.p1 TRINITY_DN4556_c0_g1~~TRINITY_DN4556_c0_g1_i1.p1  ORF type:complete len:513 (+),score=80.51 TRINITY_DN4556_c0_g1_i1:115-1653(+)